MTLRPASSALSKMPDARPLLPTPAKPLKTTDSPRSMKSSSASSRMARLDFDRQDWMCQGKVSSIQSSFKPEFLIRLAIIRLRLSRCSSSSSLSRKAL